MSAETNSVKPANGCVTLKELESWDIDQCDNWPQKKCLDFIQENGALLSRKQWDVELIKKIHSCELATALFKKGLFGGYKLYSQIPQRLLIDPVVALPFLMTRIGNHKHILSEEVRIQAPDKVFTISTSGQTVWITEAGTQSVTLLDAPGLFLEIYACVQYILQFEELAKETLSAISLPAPLIPLVLGYAGYPTSQEKLAAQKEHEEALEAFEQACVKLSAENDDED